jgi:hypothetical protein
VGREDLVQSWRWISRVVTLAAVSCGSGEGANRRHIDGYSAGNRQGIGRGAWEPEGIYVMMG